MRQRTRRIRCQALDQHAENARLRKSGGLALANAPCAKIVKIRQLETIQRTAAVARGGVLELFERAALQFAIGKCLKLYDVDRDIRCLEPHVDPIGQQPLMPVVVHEVA